MPYLIRSHFSVRFSRAFFRLTLFCSLFFLGTVSTVFAAPATPVLTDVRLTSNNSNAEYAKAGNTVTIFFSSNKNLDVNPVVTIAGTTTGVTVTRHNPPFDWNAYRIITENDASGLLSFSIAYSSAEVPGVTATATTDLSFVTIDTTAPTAALTLSQATVRADDSLIITATLSEPILDSPALALSFFGGNTLATTTFTKTDSTDYSFAQTVGAGNGTTTVSLGAATDRAGNSIVSAPTSGAQFFVDNIAPTIASATLISGNQITVSYSEPITSPTTDYSALTLVPGGTRSLLGIVASTSQSVTLVFDGASASVSATGTLAVGDSVRDIVGNQLVASTTVLADGQAPLAPGTPTLNSSSALINAARESAGFAALVPLSSSGAVVGDSMELLLGSASFLTPLRHTITTADVVFGSAVFAIEHGQLGADGAKAISARLTDSAGNVGAAGGTLFLSLDTVSPTLASAKVTGGNQITFTYSESVFSTTTDYASPILSGDTRVVALATGSSTATILLSFGGAAVPTNATGTITIGHTVTDSAGNALTATTTALADGQSPTATLSHSKSPVKAGDSLTITATLSEPILDSPALALSLFGADTLATTTFAKTDSTHYSFVQTVGAGNGTATVSLGAATDLAGNAIASAPTSGADFSVDNIAPTASASYSKNPVKAGDTLTISVVTSEAIASGTPLLISVSGANTAVATSTTRADNTHFSLSYSAGLGDGAATIALSGGTDSAGNIITAAPTAHGTLTIDNTAPAVTIANPNSAPAHRKTVTATVSDGTLTQHITTAAVCNGTLSFSAYASTTFAAEADNGKRICYRALDSADNVAFLFSDAIAGIDFTPPAITALSLSPSSGTRKIGDAITLSVTADAAGYTLGSLAINAVATTSMVDAGNGFYFATTTVAQGDSDRAGGTVPVSVVFVDAAGNRNATSTGVTANALAVDAHAPTLVSARTTSTTTIELTFSEDLNGATVTSTGTDFTVSGFTISSASEVTPGVVRLTLGSAMTTRDIPVVNYISSVKDLAGNVAPVAGPITPEDGVSPVVSETSAVPLVTNDNTPHYAFTAGEAGNISYGGDCTSSTATATSGPNTLSFGTLSDGAHSNCTITVIDVAGNASSQLLVSPFTVDTIEPSVILSSTAANPTRFSQIPFVATFSEPVSGFESGDISVANGTVGSFVTASSTLYSFVVTSASDGAVTASIGAMKAIDSAANGNSAAAGLSRTFDSIAPTLTIAPYTFTQTNQDITVNASANEGVLNISSHLFTANSSFNFVATDAAGNAATTTITITNIDKAAPVIAAHATVTVEATSTLGALGSYSAPSANDAVDGATVVSCSPLSGLQFALGATAITCTSTDRAGNAATTTFALNITDTTAPAITVPSAQSFEATAVLSTPTLVLASSTDAVSTTTIALSHFPTSFSMGATVVTWTARDGAGNSATATSSVTIKDTTAPSIASHDTVSAPAESAAGAIITYAPPGATDLGSGAVGVLCSPSSGIIFALGTTTVSCSAVDAKQNVATSSFAVVVTREIPLAGTVSVNPGAPDIVVRSGIIATSTIAIPTGVASSRLNLLALLTVSTSTRQAHIGGAVMVTVETTGGSVSLALPQGLQISGGNSWDGSLLLPRAVAASPTPPPATSGMSASVSAVIEVGSDSTELTLSRAARLLLPGAAQHLVGSTRSGAAFTPIAQTCVSDTQSVVDAQLGSTVPAACKISVGSDLVVWTNHFTSFVAYTETLLPPPPPFLGGNGPIMVSRARGAAAHYGVPISGGAAFLAAVPQAMARASVVLPPAITVLPTAPQPASPSGISIGQGIGANQNISTTIPAPHVSAQTQGAAVERHEARVAFQATVTPNTLAKTKPKAVFSAPSVQELAAAAVSAESNSALARIKKGWSAFVQKLRSLRRQY